MCNVLLWWVAALTAFLVAARWFDRAVGYLTSFFVATGTGFIVYVAQPFNYLAAWALIPIILWIYEKWIDGIGDERGPTVGRITLFGAFIGLCSMVYDIFPLYLFIIGYGLLRKVPLWRLAGSLAIAFGVYFGFLWLETGYLQIMVDRTNLRDIVDSRKTWLKLVTHPTVNHAYGFSFGLIELYAGHMAKAFLVLPLIPASFGLTTLRTGAQKAVVALLLVPPILTLAYFLGGESYIFGMPRFVYASFLAVYILAAAGLRTLGASRVGQVIAAAFLVAVVLVNNADVLGYPKLYFHFYHGGQTTSPGYFTAQ